MPSEKPGHVLPNLAPGDVASVIHSISPQSSASVLQNTVSLLSCRPRVISSRERESLVHLHLRVTFRTVYFDAATLVGKRRGPQVIVSGGLGLGAARGRARWLDSHQLGRVLYVPNRVEMTHLEDEALWVLEAGLDATSDIFCSNRGCGSGECYGGVLLGTGR